MRFFFGTRADQVLWAHTTQRKRTFRKSQHLMPYPSPFQAHSNLALLSRKSQECSLLWPKKEKKKKRQSEHWTWCQRTRVQNSALPCETVLWQYMPDFWFHSPICKTRELNKLSPVLKVCSRYQWGKSMMKKHHYSKRNGRSCHRWAELQLPE